MANSRRLAFLGSLLVLGSACGSETVVHKVNERDANRILEILHDNNISAQKGVVDTGREVHFTIMVPASKKFQAIKILNQYEMPTPVDKGYDLFTEGEGGLIPTNAEERAKYMSSLEGELQRQLKLIDGVLDAQVQIVQPSDDALRMGKEQQPETTASVTIKYMPRPDGKKTINEPLVAALVAAGVEKLTPEKVVVLLTESRGQSANLERNCEPARTSRSGLWSLSVKTLNTLAVAVLVIILVLALAFLYAHIRLRSVRGRLIRLQTEIVKARRKPGDGTGMP